LAGDLEINDRLAALETIQEQLTPERSEMIAERRGQADVLIVRHILEHAHRPRLFADALKRLVRPTGYIILEIPDCEPALTRKDYSMPWEEHIAYFTPETFRNSLRVLGFSLMREERYLYSNENSLVAIVRSGGAMLESSSEHVAGQKQLAGGYAEAFPHLREATRATLAAHLERGGKVAMFGAGHLSCFWINALQVADAIEFVVDDHPQKRGRYMPGSRLLIRESSALLDEQVTLCLLSLSLESEARVVQKNQRFVEQGGTFASIFPDRPNSLVSDRSK
jgi:hypothetical protein